MRAPGCQNQVKAVLPGRTRGRTGGGGRRREEDERGYPATARPVQSTRSPGCQPARAPCAVSPYIDKNPRSQAGAGSASRELRSPRGRSENPEVAGFMLPAAGAAPPPPCHAALLRARQDAGRAPQGECPLARCSQHLPRIHSIPGGVLAVGVDGWGTCAEGMAALSAEDGSLGRREGVLFWSPGIRLVRGPLAGEACGLARRLCCLPDA